MTQTPTRAAAEPPWFAAARREVGVHEGAGDADDARVLDYYRDAGHPEVGHDSVAWCAAFACAMLERSGTASPRTLRARDFLRWGEPLSRPRPGAVTILWRGDPASGQGHVAFYAGSRGDHVLLLGGNQGDAVSIAAFPANRVLGYRWPTLLPKSGDDPPVEGDTSIFPSALAHVLVQEGGWTDDPFDPGGPTNKGITLAELARWDGVALTSANLGDFRARLRNLDDATLQRIYTTNYWAPARCPDLPAPIAFLHFDTAVNQGVRGAARLLQAALRVEVDGEIGPLTLAAAARADPRALIDAYCEKRRVHYRSLQHFWRFGRGWLARVDRTRLAALALVDRPISAPPRDTASRKDTPVMAPNSSPPTDAPTKWWAHSLTIWGVIVTSLSTFLPLVARAFGIDLPAELVQDLGTQLTAVVQALGGLAGIVMTIAGRIRASQRLNLSAMPPTVPPFGVRDWRKEE